MTSGRMLRPRRPGRGWQSGGMAPSSSVRPVPVPRAPSPRDTAWLEAFEEHLRHERNRSAQTVRAYLADLRALIDHVAGAAGTAATPAVDDLSLIHI